MDLVNKVGRVRHAHKRRSRVDFVHPRVQLIVVLAGKEIAPVLGNKFETVGFQVRPGDCSNVLEEDKDDSLRCRLERVSRFVTKKGVSQGP